MRVWELGLPGDECGSCSAKVDGRPAQFIAFANVKRRLIRCEACANEPRPEHIAPARQLHPYHPPPGLEVPQRLAFEEPTDARVIVPRPPRPKPAASGFVPAKALVAAYDGKARAAGGDE